MSPMGHSLLLSLWPSQPQRRCRRYLPCSVDSRSGREPGTFSVPLLFAFPNVLTLVFFLPYHRFHTSSCTIMNPRTSSEPSTSSPFLREWSHNTLPLIACLCLTTLCDTLVPFPPRFPRFCDQVALAKGRKHQRFIANSRYCSRRHAFSRQGVLETGC